MKKILLLLCAVALAACAKPAMQPPQESDAGKLWQKMETASAKAAGPYRLQMSMRFGEEGNTRRVTALMWGNGDGPLRLDVMAGVGATVAMISESGDDFLLYAPRENRAWFHQGETRPMLKIGVPVPFDLARLAGLLTGDFTQAFGMAPESGAMLANGGAEFTLEAPLAGTLELNPEGEPVKWRQNSGLWQLTLAYDEDAPFLPKSLRLENRDGKRAIILIKERETPKAPFTADQLKLSPPASAPMLPLAEYKPS